MSVCLCVCVDYVLDVASASFNKRRFWKMQMLNDRG